MKKIIFSVITLSFLFSYSQQQTFTINWNGTKTIGTESKTLEVPYFDNGTFNYDFETGLMFVAQWDISSLINERTATITNVSYSNINESELKDINRKSIPKTLMFKVKNAISRDDKKGYVEISPIIKENGIFKRVNSFSVNYSNNSFSRNGQNSQEITNSVLSNGEWYRFYVDTTGVYKLSRNFLRNLGVNVNNVDPRSIRVFGNGGQMLPLANNANFQLDMVENAVKVVGEEDGVFNSNDYI